MGSQCCGARPFAARIVLEAAWQARAASLRRDGRPSKQRMAFRGQPPARRRGLRTLLLGLALVMALGCISLLVDTNGAARSAAALQQARRSAGQPGTCAQHIAWQGCAAPQSAQAAASGPGRAVPCLPPCQTHAAPMLLAHAGGVQRHWRRSGGPWELWQGGACGERRVVGPPLGRGTHWQAKCRAAQGDQAALRADTGHMVRRLLLTAGGTRRAGAPRPQDVQHGLQQGEQHMRPCEASLKAGDRITACTPCRSARATPSLARVLAQQAWLAHPPTTAVASSVQSPVRCDCPQAERQSCRCALRLQAGQASTASTPRSASARTSTGHMGLRWSASRSTCPTPARTPTRWPFRDARQARGLCQHPCSLAALCSAPGPACLICTLLERMASLLAAGECDEAVAICYCPANTTFGRIPAPQNAPMDAPPQQHGRPMHPECQPNNFLGGTRDPNELFGPDGWCTAKESKTDCPCNVPGFAGRYCDEPIEEVRLRERGCSRAHAVFGRHASCCCPQLRSDLAQYCANSCNGRGDCFSGFCKCHKGEGASHIVLVLAVVVAVVGHAAVA